MHEKRSKFILAVLGLVLVGIFIAGLSTGLPQLKKIHLPAPNSPQPGYYRVTKFDDGDTIAIDMGGKTETIRFIGVDTPETHDPRKAVQCFGLQAAAFTKNLISKNKVRLEADAESANRDRYDRLLRFVYLPDGTLVNAEIIKQGYGFAYTSFPFSKSDEFKRLQTAAINGKKGLWADCKPVKNQYGGYTSPDAQ